MELLYKPGEIIQDNCEAFVKVLFEDYRTSRCHNCFKGSPSLKVCTSCRVLFYCGKKCQKDDWKNGHKVECGSNCYRNYLAPHVESLRIVFRMFAFLQMNPEMAKKKFQIYDGTQRCFNDLMSHEEYEAKNLVFLFQCTFMAESLTKEGFKVDTDYLVLLSSIYQTNGFGMCDSEVDDEPLIGSGIFIQTSVFNHSCKPTAVAFICKDSQMQARAIAPILKGEQPLISYIGDILDKSERRKRLRERYNFECRCEICESNVDARVDYKMLEKMASSFETRTYPMISWKHTLDLHNEIIGVMRKIYHEYDDRITNQFSHIVADAVEVFNVPRKKVDRLVAETRRHLLMTFGPDDFHYKDFETFDRMFRF